MIPKPPARPEPDGDRAALGSGEAMRSVLQQRLDGMPANLCTPPPIPDHLLLHRIGTGAYGEVWLARSALGTLRAVKIVYRDRFQEERPYQREFNGILNYEPISRSHESLVAVLHVGRNDEAGCFYYVMELADDANPERGMRNPESYRPRTLRLDPATRQRLRPAEAAQMALRLAGALAHLHDHGLVHRDVKPSNVIFVGGQPKLADIGLVTGAGDSRSFVGTDGFIPPEGPGTAQGDLYGLGKLLYELATGHDRLDFPQLPLGVTHLPEGEALLDLNEVITRACEPDPRHRYLTAVQLQADLNFFLAGHSLRRARKLETNLAWLRRFAILACALAVLAGLAGWMAKRKERQAHEREQSAQAVARAEAALRKRAEVAERLSRQDLYSALLAEAHATVRSGELGQRIATLQAVHRAGAISNSAELRREALAALVLPDLRFERETAVGPGVTLWQLDPTFQRMAIGHGPGPVEIRASADQRLLATLAPSTNLSAVAGKWSVDGRFLAVKRDLPRESDVADLEVWDVANVRSVLVLHGLPFGPLAFHPHQAQILSGESGNEISLRDLERNGQEVTGFKLGGTPIHLLFSPAGERFAALCRVGPEWAVSVYETATAKLVDAFLYFRQVASFDWHPDGRWLAVPDARGDVHLADVVTGASSILGRHKLEGVTAVFSPGGSFLVTGGRENELICWDLSSRQRAFTAGLQGSKLQFRADGQECAMLTENGVQYHAFERPLSCREFNTTFLEQVSHASFSADARWLAVSGRNCIGVWDWRNGDAPGLAGKAEAATPFFTPDSSELFAYWNNGIGRWRVPPLTNDAVPWQLDPLPVAKPWRIYSSFLYSTNLVLTGAGGVKMVPLAEVSNGKGYDHAAPQGFGCISPNNRWVVFRYEWEPFLRIYRPPEMEYIHGIETRTDVMNFTFTPQSDELVVATRAGVEFYDPSTWQLTRRLPLAMDRYAGLIFAPDGRSFWVNSDVRSSGLYDTRTLELLLPLPAGIVPLALSPNGHDLAVSLDTRRLQVWDMTVVRKQLRELGIDWPGS